MKKTIVVRMKKSHRIGIRFLSFCFIGIIGGTVLYARTILESFAPIVFLVPVIPLLLLLLYFETWQITFGADKICKKVFFIPVGCYPYYSIKDVMMYHSQAERAGLIRILFSNGKKIRFRIDSENANAAKQRIRTHHFIRWAD